MDATPTAPIPRLDAFQRRHKWLGFPLAVFYKFFDDTGFYLAALLTYYGFISLFPLLLILSTVLGIVLANDEELRQRILETTLTQFPVVGDQLGDPRQLSGGTKGIIIGVVGSLYGGIGVAQALQYAMNTAWCVPRNSRPNPFLARGRSLGLLVTGGIGVLLTTSVSIAARTGNSIIISSETLGFVATAVSAAIFVVVFRQATARSLSIRDVLPGAVFAAVGWHLLQEFGIAYVDAVVRNASTSNGVFALVLGLIAFIFIGSVVLVLGVEINVVRVDRLHPRSLLTPFIDNVVLTDGDVRAYTGQARAQRLKGYEEIHVAFEGPREQWRTYDAPKVPMLTPLTRRRGDRPTTSNEGPHRQLDQQAGAAMWGQLAAALFAIPGVSEGHSTVSQATSRALLLEPGDANGPSQAFMGPGEFAHLHGVDDTSLHLCLPVDRAKHVCELGWGEAHGHAEQGTEIMLYGPRDAAELEVVLGLVRESLRFARG